jgi:molecular chaperone DnaJ
LVRPRAIYIFLHVKRHKVFERDGTTLLTRVPISFTTAALGGTDRDSGAGRHQAQIDIPAGIQSGKQLRKRGAGMPVLNGAVAGEVAVETPTKLSARRNCCASFRPPRRAMNAPR